MNWLRNFMYGRHGADQLCFALLILGMALTLTANLTGSMVLALVSYLPLAYSVFRMLSKNHMARMKENQMFLKFWNPVKGWFKTAQSAVRDRKTHRYYRCPKCHQAVRVPKNKGKIRIICPKCRQEFVKKT